MNNDGYLDIVVGNGGDSPNKVFLNLVDDDGKRGFKLAGTFGDLSDGENHTTSIKLGDLDNDGKLDIVQMESGTGAPATLYLSGDSIGTTLWWAFPALKPWSKFCTLSSGERETIQLGDMNDDGNLDIVTVGGGALRVFFNDGHGDFHYPIEALGDVKGHAQFAGFLPFYGPEPVEILGDVEGYPKCIALADVNKDGHLDVVVGNNCEYKEIFINTADGYLAKAGMVGTDKDFTDSIAVGDVNNDGTVDVVVGNWGAQTTKIYFNEYNPGRITSSEAHVTINVKVVAALTRDAPFDLSTVVAVNPSTSNDTLKSIVDHYTSTAASTSVETVSMAVPVKLSFPSVIDSLAGVGASSNAGSGSLFTGTSLTGGYSGLGGSAGTSLNTGGYSGLGGSAGTWADSSSAGNKTVSQPTSDSSYGGIIIKTTITDDSSRTGGQEGQESQQDEHTDTKDKDEGKDTKDKDGGKDTKDKDKGKDTKDTDKGKDTKDKGQVATRSRASSFQRSV